MSNKHPEPGWWQCEQCNGDVRPADATTKRVDGGKGNIELLAFCEDCSE
jgi:hypothetical protein